MLFGKYKYTDSEERELLDSIVILVDTREKVNDHITDYFDKHHIPYKKKALKNGDYSFFVPQKYLLIENANYEDIVNGKYNTQYNKKSYLGSIHSFNHKYDLEIVFMPDNTYSPIFIYGVMQYYLRNLIR